MGKREKPPAPMVEKSAHGFMPVTAYDAELLIADPVGTEYDLVKRTRRSWPQLKLYWSMLNRIVKAATGLTAHAYIGRKLIDEAKRELVFTHLAAQEIGLRLGFADPAYFSRYFLRETGETPRAFRLCERARLAAQSAE